MNVRISGFGACVNVGISDQDMCSSLGGWGRENLSGVCEREKENICLCEMSESSMCEGISG